MVGFSLKKDGAEPKKSGFGGFSLKKKDSKIKKSPPKPFGKPAENDDQEERVVQIDTFDSKDGGYDKSVGPEAAPGKLTIENEGNDGWRKAVKAKLQTSPVPSTEGEKERKLKYGINHISQTKTSTISDTTSEKNENQLLKEDAESRPPMPTEEDYDEVPIEGFGAAMLRGMGWNSDEEDESHKQAETTVKRASYLGVGAKVAPLDGDDLITDKLYMPLKMVRKRDRDRSPIRSDTGSYRARD